MSTSLDQTHGRMGDRYSSVLSSASLSVETFRHCHLVFSIDGIFLIGKYHGTLLIAISCDTNNKLVPLAFALVERENNDS
jgi:hypothetical protein